MKKWWEKDKRPKMEKEKKRKKRARRKFSKMRLASPSPSLFSSPYALFSIMALGLPSDVDHGRANGVARVHHVHAKGIDDRSARGKKGRGGVRGWEARESEGEERREGRGGECDIAGGLKREAETGRAGRERGRGRGRGRKERHKSQSHLT